MVKDFVDDLGFLLGQHIEITVVVVADVMVVEPRHAATLVVGAEPLVVPIDDHVLAVGVDRWHDQQYGFVHPREFFGILGCCKVMNELGHHLSAANLGRVDRATDQGDDLALVHQLLRLLRCEVTRFGEEAGDLAQPHQIRLVFL